MIVICNGRSAEMDLTLRHKMLYLWLLSFWSWKQAVSVSASLGTSYRCKHSRLLDRLYKNQATMDTCTSLQLGKQLDSWGDTSSLHRSSRFCISLLAFAFASLVRETASKPMSLLGCWLVNVLKQDVNTHVCAVYIIATLLHYDLNMPALQTDHRQ